MKTSKKILSILLSCFMLMGMLSVGVLAAEGTQENPINANDKWFGFGIDCYLLNPTFADNNTGLWYELTANQDGILYLEHKYKDTDYVDYTITITDANGNTYEGGNVDKVLYNGPIMTLPVQADDVITIQIVPKDGAAGTVYASIYTVTGDSDDPIKVKSEGITVHVAAGETVYFQDDSLNAVYATKGLLVNGNVGDTKCYAVTRNAEDGSVSKKAFVDSDQDNIIEAKLGGSLGSAGAPPVKPMWAIENASTEDQCYDLTVVNDAHECIWTDDSDTDCNNCGATREIIAPEVQPNIDSALSFSGNSVSEAVNGAGFKFTVEATGIVWDNAYNADYTNAYVNIEGVEYKLLGMGAIANNKQLENCAHQDVNDITILDIKALKVFDDTHGDINYAIRIIDIPSNQKDTEIVVRPYIIYEDANGNEVCAYGTDVAASYNGILNNNP